MRARVERLQATEMSETPVTPQAAAPSPEAAHNPLGCRAHEVLARVGDKWSVYVIHVLGETALSASLTLRGIVGQLVQWSQAHLPEIDAARARYDAREPGWATTDD